MRKLTNKKKTFISFLTLYKIRNYNIQISVHILENLEQKVNRLEENVESKKSVNFSN